MALIADYHKREKGGGRLTDLGRKQLTKAEQYLASKAISFEDLSARRDEIIEGRRQARNALAQGLDGENARIPGFPLPLEFDGMKATEFLRVPFVDACIRVPPTPLKRTSSVPPGDVRSAQRNRTFTHTDRRDRMWPRALLSSDLHRA